jgi:cell wall-associated NlpC family hydrolase
MMHITIDLLELDNLIQLYDESERELAGIGADISRRIAMTDFAKLTSYGINPGSCLGDVEHTCSRLTDDVLRLQNSGTELRQQLWQAGQSHPGGLGPFGAVLPDAAWYRLHALSDRGPSPDRGQMGPALPDGTQALGASPSPFATAQPSVGAVGIGATGDVRQRIVGTAEQWVGIPYLWGGGHGAVVAPRGVNVDCSGLVHEVFGENGLNIGGTAATMYASGAPVTDLAHALPGDLLFWGSGSNIHHVAIYIGNGQMIEAPHTGAWVHVTNVYGGDFAGIRRVLA